MDQQRLLPFNEDQEERLPTREKVYREGFRVSVNESGVLIEAIDYHSRPLLLDAAALMELGLSLRIDVAHTWGD
jgi:hypothetical protein